MNAPIKTVRDVQATPASVNYLASKAKTAGELLTLMTVTVPIALGVTGAILLGIAILRRNQPATAPAAARAAAGDAPQPQNSRLDASPPR
jgi:hypothetical protein